MLGLCCCMGSSLVVMSRGCSAPVCRLLTVVTSLAAQTPGHTGFSSYGTCAQYLHSCALEHRLNCVGHRLSTCGIILDQGLNACLPHWQVDSLPLCHQGSPIINFFFLITQHVSHSGKILFHSENFPFVKTLKVSLTEKFTSVNHCIFPTRKKLF